MAKYVSVIIFNKNKILLKKKRNLGSSYYDIINFHINEKNIDEIDFLNKNLKKKFQIDIPIEKLFHFLTISSTNESEIKFDIYIYKTDLNDEEYENISEKMNDGIGEINKNEIWKYNISDILKYSIPLSLDKDIRNIIEIKLCKNKNNKES